MLPKLPCVTCLLIFAPVLWGKCALKDGTSGVCKTTDIFYTSDICPAEVKELPPEKAFEEQFCHTLEKTIQDHNRHAQKPCQIPPPSQQSNQGRPHSKGKKYLTSNWKSRITAAFFNSSDFCLNFCAAKDRNQFEGSVEPLGIIAEPQIDLGRGHGEQNIDDEHDVFEIIDSQEQNGSYKSDSPDHGSSHKSSSQEQDGSYGGSSLAQGQSHESSTQKQDYSHSNDSPKEVGSHAVGSREQFGSYRGDPPKPVGSDKSVSPRPSSHEGSNNEDSFPEHGESQNSKTKEPRLKSRQKKLKSSEKVLYVRGDDEDEEDDLDDESPPHHGQHELPSHESITGGEPVSITKMPFLAILKMDMGFGTSYCTSSILTNKWVLTAAHCVSNIRDPSNVEIIAGQSEFSRPDARNNTQARKASQVIVHPTFRHLESPGNGDVALIKVNTPLFLDGHHVAAIKLRGRPWFEQGRRDDCTSAGWGRQNFYAQNTGPLQSFKSIALHGEDSCPCVPSDQKTRVVCLERSAGKGICKGDSGGPLICDGEVVGVAHVLYPTPFLCWQIFAGEPQCGGNGWIDIYMYTCPYLGWIKKYVGERIPAQPENCSAVRLSRQAVLSFAVALVLTFLRSHFIGP